MRDSTMKTFPIMLDMRGKLAVVVGGGAVGRRKARSLIAAGAAVRVIDPAGPNIAGATVVARAYRKSDLKGAMLVFACTGERATNARIAADARAAGALVNAVDQIEDCDFLAPAVLQRGKVVVAVGTGGTAPALAKLLKKHMATAMPQKIAGFAAALERIRHMLRHRPLPPQRRQAVMKQLAGEGGYQLFMAGGAKSLRQRCLELCRV
ncbi:MAG: bifunctional precorrin-2 dehydrogenase/sirohydrochlorin ferrochelatase [Planctomycetaceae bacterium]|nr:bifunctional precorrin-2 dehydrogenase/sirohydrochlorin ferrochelatase [Planctomycetaceae bacterium]